MIYLVAALAVSAAFLAVGWRSGRARVRARGENTCPIHNDPLWAESHVELSDSKADAGAALRLVLQRLSPLIAARSVQVDVAAPLGLPVRIRGTILLEFLEDMLTNAVNAAPGSRLLVTASPHGERIYISMTDDRAGANLSVRQAGLRSLMERVAMRGATLDVYVRPTDGTSMTLRLLAAWERAPSQDHDGPASPRPMVIFDTIR